MENEPSELHFEKKRLETTIALAKKQIHEAKYKNEENKSAIIAAKQELRENTVHSISNLSSSEGFEALAELSQYTNPITEKVMDYEKIEKKIATLEKLIKSPYFARIDFKFDDEDEFEKVYIGRSSLIEDDSYEIIVYDWRSPIASVFYRFALGKAYYDAPSGRITGEVNLKREYEIVNGELKYFYDAEVQIVDEFLKKLLSQNTSNQMKAIVETIQKEQDLVIRDMENELMMVQGVAGSGKTSVALHRAAYLMYQGLSNTLSSNNIMIISPNSLFEQYISSVLPELGEDNVASAVFEEMLSEILQNEHIQPRSEFLESIISSSKYGALIKSSMEFKMSPEFLEILNSFISDLAYQWIEFEDVYYKNKCIVKKEILRDKISGRKETPIGMKLEQLEEYILDLISESKKKPLGKLEVFHIKNDIQRFTKLNIKNLYRKFINNKEYFYHIAKDIELHDDIEEILRFTAENLNIPYLCYDDAAVLAYLHLKIYGSREYINIKQVVIDEAQDYYPLHYEIFHLLFKHSKFTILGDINQTLEKKEDLSLYEQIQKILDKKKASLITMNKSFRCTNEILNYSSKFIDHDLEIKSFNRDGEEPKVYTSDDASSFNHKIISEVQLCLEEGYETIGLICKTAQNADLLYESLKDKTNLKLIKSGDVVDLHGVNIIPVYMSKGLEFDAVLICDADSKNYQSEDDKKLLYIACTRALHRLNLFCRGEASPLL
ncbi:DNA helicase-2/ATP-dependent DNA helicase PcrA [Alkalibaculum bacchi]|uniref:DNA helicase-2/ATP-dependent DNA helicase PcrA n=1 Tax=Alkalibaculum bacchi TaxID=645887 RepID=A0A366IB04_9FIRM|nr:3'-5' exonuclease [Alkalibaculum bacchi]RBP65353.1 DNA helicase-2/ATP-dependent DNA helicase PcrA [Alkalibaculum bacchi]